MARFSRRSLLAASAALAARQVLPAGMLSVGNPVFAATTPTSGPVDVAIVGAGAAGIAAARKVAAAGRRYVLIEATDHIGGRCITDTATFGVPYRPRRALALSAGLQSAHQARAEPRSTFIRRRAARRCASAAASRAKASSRIFLSAQVRATRAIDDIARKADVPCEQAMPADLGDWKPTVEFVLGPYNCAKDLMQVSSFDFAKAAERKTAAFCQARSWRAARLRWPKVSRCSSRRRRSRSTRAAEFR